MRTVLVEIEAIINSRPLTYVSEDIEEGPLTPSQLLIGRRLTALPLGSHQELDLSSDRSGLLRREKHRLSLVNKWWTRWHSEHLQNLLRHNNNWRSRNGIKVGDVVLIHDENARRQMWKSGIVMETVPGRDGRVRLARVKTATDIITRPIQRLYPMELSIYEEEVPDGDVPDQLSSEAPDDDVPDQISSGAAGLEPVNEDLHELPPVSGPSEAESAIISADPTGECVGINGPRRSRFGRLLRPSRKARQQ